MFFEIIRFRAEPSSVFTQFESIFFRRVGENKNVMAENLVKQLLKIVTEEEAKGTGVNIVKLNVK